MAGHHINEHSNAVVHTRMPELFPDESLGVGRGGCRAKERIHDDGRWYAGRSLANG